MATSFVKTAPCFPGSAISGSDCRSGTPGVPGNIHALQRYSGRSGKKSCRGTSNEGDPVFLGSVFLRGVTSPPGYVLFRSQGSGVGDDPPAYLCPAGAILTSVRLFQRLF